MLFLSSVDFFQNQLFQKKIQGISSECQQIGFNMFEKVADGTGWQ